jgi:hypothetical protein
MIDILTNAPVAVRFGDRTYRVGALKMLELGQLQRWIRDHAIRPTVQARADLEYLPPEEHAARMKAAHLAERDWPPSIGSEEGNRILLTDLDGQRFFLTVLFAKYQPDLTAADVDAILAGLSPEDYGVLVALAFGEDGLDPEVVRAAVGPRIAAATVAAPAAPAPASTGIGSSAA